MLSPPLSERVYHKGKLLDSTIRLINGIYLNFLYFIRFYFINSHFDVVLILLQQKYSVCSRIYVRSGLG